MNCAWNMGTDCAGEVSNRKLFGKQITIPVCDGHLLEHLQVMYLHQENFDVEEVLMMSAEEREFLSNTVKDNNDGFFVL